MPEIFRSSRSGSIADLLRQQGEVAARGVVARGEADAQKAASRGQIWGQAIQGITQGVSGTLRDLAQRRAEAPERDAALKQRQMQSDLIAHQLSQMETSQAQAKIGDLAQMVASSNYDPATAEPIFQAIAKLSPEYAQPLQRALMDPAQLKQVTDHLVTLSPGYRAPEGFTLSEGQSRFGPNGQVVGSVPKSVPPPPPAQPFTLGEGQVRYNPDGTIAAQGPQKVTPPTRPVSVAPGGRLVNPETGSVVFAAPPAPSQSPQRFTPMDVTVDGKMIKANFDALTGKYHDIDTGAVLTGVQSPPTADMRNKESGRKLVTSSVTAIETLSKNILTKVGPAQRAQAIQRGAEAVFGKDPQFRAYQDARMALAGNLAVAQQGSRPSDADIKAIWLPLVPDPYRDTKESAEIKWSLIKTMANIDGGASSTPSSVKVLSITPVKPK